MEHGIKKAASNLTTLKQERPPLSFERLILPKQQTYTDSAVSLPKLLPRENGASICYKQDKSGKQRYYGFA